MKDTWKIREDGLGWEETSIKVVGRPRRRSPTEVLKWNEEMLRLAPAWRRQRIKGVYRFKTWEEKDEWDQKIRMGIDPHLSR